MNKRICLLMLAMIAKMSYAEWLGVGCTNNHGTCPEVCGSIVPSDTWRVIVYNDPWFYCEKWYPEIGDPTPCDESQPQSWDNEQQNCVVDNQGCMDFTGGAGAYNGSDSCIQNDQIDGDCPPGYTCFGPEMFEPVPPPSNVFEDDENFIEEPQNDGCPSGYVRGTVNGNDVCVRSETTDNNGGNTDSPERPAPHTWGDYDNAPTVEREETSVREYSDENGTPFRETTTSTTTNNRHIDITPSAPSAPYVCSDGRPAGSIIDCDSTQTCPEGYYLENGFCVPLASDISITDTQTTTTTTTTENLNNGNTDTQTQNSTVQTPSPSPSGPRTSGGGTVELDILQGPCDPSQPEYLDCLSSSSVMPEHTDTSQYSIESINADFYSRVEQSELVQSFSAVADIVPSGNGSCPGLTIDLSATLIGRSVSTTIICDITNNIAPIIEAIMTAVWILLGWRIIASA